jgi:hypothetical protein
MRKSTAMGLAVALAAALVVALALSRRPAAQAPTPSASDAQPPTLRFPDPRREMARRLENGLACFLPLSAVARTAFTTEAQRATEEQPVNMD